MMENITWMLRIFQKEILAVPGKAIILAFFVVVFMIPLFVTNHYILNVLIVAAIYAIFATSWDLISGYTGQVNLGHALFFGVGAYTVAILNVNYGYPTWLAIPLGSIAAVVVGLIAGIPALRLRGFYLALVTLSFPIILSGAVMFFADFTGGENGIPGVKSLSNNPLINYYIVYLIMTLSIFIMYKLTDASKSPHAPQVSIPPVINFWPSPPVDFLPALREGCMP